MRSEERRHRFKLACFLFDAVDKYFLIGFGYTVYSELITTQECMGPLGVNCGAI